MPRECRHHNCVQGRRNCPLRPVVTPEEAIGWVLGVRHAIGFIVLSVLAYWAAS